MDKQVGKKDHIDYGDDLDILIRPEGRISVLESSFGSLVGAGIPFFGVGGGLLRWVLYQVLTDFHVQRGYRVVITPSVASTRLFAISGHLDFYKENMYIFNIENHEFAIKPMNCPFHVLILMNLLQKYREKVPFPFRLFELGTVHRYELSGALYGLLRVRGFTQDDAHIFAEAKDMKAEILKTVEEMKEIYEKLFALPVNAEHIKLRLSMSDPEKIGTDYIGEREQWKAAEEYLRGVAQEIERRYGIEYFEEKGEAAFYGPKLDVVANLGEVGEWQIGTVQFDFNLPYRFKLVDLLRKTTGKDADLYMVHRAYLGSIERFLGVYLDYRKGRLPFVLNPIQITLFGIVSGNEEEDSKIKEMCESVKSALVSAGIRVVTLYVDKVRVSKFVRKIESTVRPSIQVFVGAREIESRTASIKFYELEARKYSVEKVAFADHIELVQGILDVVEKLEAPVEELTGKKYRLYEDLSYMV